MASITLSATRTDQRGAVLVVSLILMTVASLVTVISMRGSILQERMTSNQNNQAIALMAAETGGSEFWSWLRSEHENNTLKWADSTWQNSWKAEENDLHKIKRTTANIGSYGAYWVTGTVWKADEVIVDIGGSAVANDTTLSTTALRLVFKRPGSSLHPAFFKGMLAAGNITINGKATFNGSIHTNSTFTNNSGGSSLNNWQGTDEEGKPVTNIPIISAKDYVNYGGNINGDGSTQSNAELIVLPSASDFIEANKNNTSVIKSCTPPSGNGHGAIYYCDGNMNIGAGDYSNVTIMAEGNITHKGASSLGTSNELNIAFIAKGNITVNGSNDTYGIFWSEGNVTQNGSSTLGGSIIAGGSITRNGAFNYTQVDSFSDSLPLPQIDSELAIVQWEEIR